MNVRNTRLGFGPVRRLPSAVAHRWPALAVATVAAVVPMSVALANSGPTVFEGTAGQPAITATNPFGGAAMQALSSVFIKGGRLDISNQNDLAILAIAKGRNAIESLTDNGAALKADTSSGSAIVAESKNGNGVDATGTFDGVKATALYGTGVDAFGDVYGVKGSSVHGPGVSGDSDAGPGVKATSKNGPALDASASKTAVQARSYNGTGLAASSGGTNSVAVSAYADQPGTIGVNAFGASMGVYGEGGTGVFGRSYTGYGAELGGARAPLRLQPGQAVGAPQTGTHQRGELYIDSQGQLFLCVADSASGGVSTWKKVVLQ